MNKKTRKYRIVFVTLVSVILFCSLLIAASLSPLADSGPDANKFAGLGVWIAIGTVLAFYLLPLFVYCAGVDAMRFVMAILCGIGLLINLSILVAISVMGVFTENMTPASLVVIGLSITGFIVNIIWFFAAFRSSLKPDLQ